VLAFERIQVYVPPPRDSSSELIVTATRVTNATSEIVCVVDPGIGMGDLVRSDPVQLLVYGKLSCSYTAIVRGHFQTFFGKNSIIMTLIFLPT
jgi:hypothetical protein